MAKANQKATNGLAQRAASAAQQALTNANGDVAKAREILYESAINQMGRGTDNARMAITKITAQLDDLRAQTIGGLNEALAELQRLKPIVAVKAK